MGLYKHFWQLNIKYDRGDIVLLDSTNRYYICMLEHTSNDLVCPGHIEEMYWEEINDDFVNMLTQVKNNDMGSTNSNSYFNSMLFNPYTIFPINNTMGNYLQPPPGFPLRRNSIDVVSTPNLISKEQLEEMRKKKKFERKIKNIEEDLEQFKKKRKINETLTLKQKILLLNVDKETKLFLLDKYDKMKNGCSSDSGKSRSWLNIVTGIPFGKYKQLPVKNIDPADKINEYFELVKQRLDESIHGMDYVKEEILEYLAKKISNPGSKGQVLALEGFPGTGKTKILKSLAYALELPFHQINFGGLNDVSVLTGHSETYVGSKPGKIVEILSSSNCMNPIVYLDEIDKMSNYKEQELNGILTHLLDEEQNDKFQDNYLSNVNINLSKVFFVIAFNDINKIDKIVADRLKIIKIKPPSVQDKIIIANTKMIPEIINVLNLKNKTIEWKDNSILEYIISNKIEKEDGVRKLRKGLEKLFNKMNYLILIGKYKEKQIEIDECHSGVFNEKYFITKKFVDETLQLEEENTSYLNMYI
jgi:ATP-dependent Lon protease